eukprot:CAMPEP_0178392106 /NCGR_PEP_ID=MMETSP0689_2-20121128/11508_1 /TAXON_ID=160604 /ORGANISM="Amphidinium massartii, Strain CS-259" /LENGTH=146 /DNA_ID=CAMNT_0020012671 /DNA_START=377 /DNA_END=817 /DNA_ORIENTATION=-
MARVDSRIEPLVPPDPSGEKLLVLQSPRARYFALLPTGPRSFQRQICSHTLDNLTEDRMLLGVRHPLHKLVKGCRIFHAVLEALRPLTTKLLFCGFVAKEVSENLTELIPVDGEILVEVEEGKDQVCSAGANSLQGQDEALELLKG